MKRVFNVSSPRSTARFLTIRSWAPCIRKTIWKAPKWAEDRSVYHGEAGTVDPSPQAFGDFAQAIAKRAGIGKARVALARKLSVILHSILRSGEAFRWTEQPARG